ncbi:hypothetical protein O5D80_002819 [Batrachochytrium dendrobatidis]|nr:hypothetical protein O5D80_002819 [Batrachochytrium dendrobatidis]
MSWFNSVDANKLAGSIGSFASKIQNIAETALMEDAGLGQQHELPDAHQLDEPASTSRCSSSVDQVSLVPSLTQDRNISDTNALTLLETHNEQLEQEIQQLQAMFKKEVSERDERISLLSQKLSQSQSGDSSPTTTKASEESNARIQLLQEKLVKAVAYIKRLNEENGSLTAAVAQLKQTQTDPNLANTQQIESQQSHSLETSAEFVKLESELEQLRDQLKQRELELSQTQSECDRLRTEQEEIQKHATILQNEHSLILETVQQQSKQDKVKLDELHASLATSLTQNEQLQTQITTLSDEKNASIVEKNEAHTAIVTELTERLKVSADHESALTMRINELETQNTRFVESADNIKQQIQAEYQQKILTMQQELDKLHMDMDQHTCFTHENTHKTDSHHPSTADSHAPLIAAGSNQTDVNFIKTKLSETIKLHERQTQQWEEELADLSADLNAAQSTCASLEKELADANAKLGQTKLSKNSPSDLSDETHASISSPVLATAHTDATKADYVDEWNDDNAWEESAVTSTHDIDPSNKISTAMQHTDHGIDSSKNHTSTYQNNLDALQLELQTTIETRDRLQTMVDEYQSSKVLPDLLNKEQLDTLRVERDQLAEQLEVVNARCAVLEREMLVCQDKFATETESLKRAHEQDLSESHQCQFELEQKVSDLQSQLNIVCEKLDTATIQIEKMNQQRDQQDLEQDKMTELQSMKSMHSNEVDQLKSQISDLHIQLESLAKSSKLREDEISGKLATVKVMAAEKIKRLLADNQRILSMASASSNGDSSNSNTTTLSSTTNDATALATLQRDYTESQAQVQAHLTELTSIKNQFDLEKHRVSELIASLRHMEELVDSDKKQIDSLHATIADLQRSLEEINLRHQTQTETTAAAAATRESQLRISLDEALFELSSQAASLSVNAELETQIEALRVQVASLESTIQSQDLMTKELESQKLALVAELESALEQAHALHQEEMLNLAESHRAQLDSQQQQLLVEQEKNDTVSSMTSIISELQASIVTKDNELHEQTTHIALLTEQLHLLQSQTESIRHEYEELKATQSIPVETVDLSWVDEIIRVLQTLAALQIEHDKTLNCRIALTDAGVPLHLVESVVLLQQYIAELHHVISFKNQAIEDHERQSKQDHSELQQSIIKYKSQADELSRQIEPVQAMLVQQQTLTQELSDENQQLLGERTLLMDKLTSMKNTIGLKLQTEMAENSRLRDELALAKEQSVALQIELTNITESVHATETDSAVFSQDTIRLQSELADAQHSVDSLQAELDRLRQFLVELEDSQTQEALAMQSTNHEYKLQIESLEKEREYWSQTADESLSARHQAELISSSAKEELALMMQQVETLKSKVEQEQLSQANLQRVLEQFEASKDNEIAMAVDAVNRKLVDMTTSLELFKERANTAETQLAEIRGRIDTGANVEQDLQEKNALVGKLRRDLVQVQTHLAEAMRRIRSGNAEESVDRKLVANLLVSFLSAPRGDSKRFEILELISNILRFSNDEKFKVGLVRTYAGATDSISSVRGDSSSSTTESFMDMWIGFLVNESNTKQRPSDVSNSQETDISPLVRSALSPRVSISTDHERQGSGFGNSSTSVVNPTSPLTPTGGMHSSASGASSGSALPPPAPQSMFSSIFGSRK